MSRLVARAGCVVLALGALCFLVGAYASIWGGAEVAANIALTGFITALWGGGLLLMAWILRAE